MTPRLALSAVLIACVAGCQGASEDATRADTSRDTAAPSVASASAMNDTVPVRMGCAEFASAILSNRLPMRVMLEVEHAYRDTLAPSINVDMSTGAQTEGDMGSVRDFYRCVRVSPDDTSRFVIDAFVAGFSHGERPPRVPPPPRGVRTMTAMFKNASVAYTLRPLRKGDTANTVPAFETQGPPPTFR